MSRHGDLPEQDRICWRRPWSPWCWKPRGCRREPWSDRRQPDWRELTPIAYRVPRFGPKALP